MLKKRIVAEVNKVVRLNLIRWKSFCCHEEVYLLHNYQRLPHHPLLMFYDY